MKTKPARKVTPTAKAAAVTMEEVHQAFLTAKSDACVEYPSVVEVARSLGASVREAKSAAEVEEWELERDARHGREWHARAGLGAETEQEFCERYLKRRQPYSFSHLAAEGPEGVRLATAMARRIWQRTMDPVRQWEAELEEKAAQKAFDEIEAFRRQTAARRAA